MLRKSIIYIFCFLIGNSLFSFDYFYTKINHFEVPASGDIIILPFTEKRMPVMNRRKLNGTSLITSYRGFLFDYNFYFGIKDKTFMDYLREKLAIDMNSKLSCSTINITNLDELKGKDIKSHYAIKIDVVRADFSYSFSSLTINFDYQIELYDIKNNKLIEKRNLTYKSNIIIDVDKINLEKYILDYFMNDGIQLFNRIIVSYISNTIHQAELSKDTKYQNRKKQLYDEIYFISKSIERVKNDNAFANVATLSGLVRIPVSTIGFFAFGFFNIYSILLIGGGFTAPAAFSIVTPCIYDYNRNNLIAFYQYPEDTLEDLEAKSIAGKELLGKVASSAAFMRISTGVGYLLVGIPALFVVAGIPYSYRFALSYIILSLDAYALYMLFTKTEAEKAYDKLTGGEILNLEDESKNNFSFNIFPVFTEKESGILTLLSYKF